VQVTTDTCKILHVYNMSSNTTTLQHLTYRHSGQKVFSNQQKNSECYYSVETG